MLSVFKIDKYPGEEHTPIIVWGAGKIGNQLITMYELEYMDYNVVAVVDNDVTKQGKVIIPLVAQNMDKNSDYFKRKIPIISPTEMIQLCAKYPKCVIIIATVDMYRDEIYKQITNLDVKNTIMGWVEFRYLVVREYIDCRIKKYSSELAYQYYLCYYNFVNHNFVKKFRPIIAAVEKNISFVTVVAPPKTGSSTMARMLEKCEIPFVHYHNAFGFNEISENSQGWISLIEKKCKKFIIGVREPISQNISLFFETMTNLFSLKSDINNLDAQKLFERYIISSVMGKSDEDSIWEWMMMSRTGKNLFPEFHVQHFFEGTIQSALGIDVYKVDFDKRKGFAIAEQEGKNVFLYQLEKLDTLQQEMAEFLGIEFVNWGNINDGSDKYYNNAYKKFKEKFVIPKEYFEYCYSCDYVKHFYSEEDIAKFKDKWKGHVV